MNEIEVVELPKGIEGFLSEFKPAMAVRWNQTKGHFEIDDSEKTLEEYKNGCEVFKDSLRQIYSFGESIAKGTPKFCLALYNVYWNSRYVENPKDESTLRYVGCVAVKDSMFSVSCFKDLVGQLGISESAAYRYKDLAHFVDPETGDYYSKFKGYSLSLLSEILAYCYEVGDASLSSLKKVTKIIPSDTTIDDIRLFRKIMKAWRRWSEPFGLNEDHQKIVSDTTLKEVLKIYEELMQKAEAEKLELTMSGVQMVAKEDKSVKVLPAADEMIVKRSEYQKIKDLAQRAEKIGVCEGCKHSGTNLNKCRCCRRYEKLKDLFEN